MSQFNVLINAITVHLKAGNGDGVINAARKAIEVFGDNPAVYDFLAKGFVLKSDYANAAMAQQKAIDLGGAQLDRVLSLGEIILHRGDLQQAANIFQQVIKQVEDNVPAWLGLGHCLLMSSDFARAEKCYARVLEIQPGNSPAKTKLAMCRFKLGDALRAVELLVSARTDGVDNPETDFFLAEALRYSSRLEEAEELFESLLSNPQWKERAQRGLVTIWLSLERFDQARDLLDDLLKENPNDFELLSYKVRTLMVEGKKSESVALIEDLIDRGAENPVLWEMYADQIESPFNEDNLEKLIKLRDARLAANEVRGAARCEFALARHYSVAKDLPSEIEYLESANRILAELEPFDSEGHADAVAKLRSYYTADRIKGLQRQGLGFNPVFILCPPRSGSTLLEQALSRHSCFVAGGEKPFADHAWYDLTGGRSVVTTQLHMHASLSQDDVEHFRKSYLEHVKKSGLDTSKTMIHKGISGHKFAGLLRSAFPGARFIDLRRDPMDVAFGCFKQNFESQPFAHTYEGCAREIGLFQRNMSWWYEQMGEAVYRIDYNDLISDFQTTLSELLSWLGFEWEASCMNFSAQSRVGTASASQVRKGLFSDGVGRWLKYGELLAPLEHAMDEAGVSRNKVPAEQI